MGRSKYRHHGTGKAFGYEYWSRRPGPRGLVGKVGKKICHKRERLRGKQELVVFHKYEAVY